MKTFLIGLLTLVVLAVCAVLIGPSFIDWNTYKGDLSNAVRQATGRDLTINGDVSITMLPAPALVAEDVHFANIQGASAPDMVSLRSAQVRIKLAPLLSGDVVFESVRLIEPVIQLEVLADGRSNMSFATPTESAVPADGTGGGTDGAAAESGNALAISLESVVIQNGSLVYRDHGAGRVERLDGVNATVAAASLDGPFEATGRLIARGAPLNFDVTVGLIVHQRTVPVAATLESAVAGARATVNGVLTNLSEAPRLRGNLSLSGDNLAAAIHAVAGSESLPGGLSQAFAANGGIVAGTDRMEVNDLSFSLGDMQGTAVGSLQPGSDSTAVSAAVSVTRFDLDKWLSQPPYQPQAAARPDTAAGVVEPGGKRASAELSPPAAPGRPSAPENPAPFAIPADIIGVLDVNVGAVSYRDNLIRQVRASAEMSNGEITISQVTAQFPGSSDVAMFGFVSAVNGAPQFEGEVEATVNDLRRVLGWLDVDMPSVPLDRLRKMTVKSKLAATTKEVRVRDLDLQLDSSRITGGITMALRERPAFGANLTLDRINLDSYMPTAPAAAGGPSADGGASGQQAGAAQAGATGGGAMTVLQGLSAFDANIRARVGALTYQRTAITDVTLDATLFNGNLDIRSGRIADVAGTSLSVAGGIGPLAGVPHLKDLRVELSAPETGRLFRMLAIEPPVAPDQLGAVTFSGRLNGNVLAPTVDARLQAAGADVSIKGAVSALSADRMVDAEASLRHEDLPRLLRSLGFDYRPAGALGAIDAAAHIRGGPAGITVTGLTARTGQTEIKGDIAVALNGERPRIDANLTSGDLVVDRFLPVQRAAAAPSAYGRPGVVPARWPAAPSPADSSPTVSAATPGGERWSREPINLSVLGAFDGKLALKSTAIVYDRYRLEAADIAASLAGGVMRAERVAGRLFGGNFGGGAELDANGVPRLSSSLSLENASLGAVMAAMDAKDSTGGQLNTDLKANTSGRSVAELVGALAGSGAFSLTGVDVESQARGTPLAGLLGLVGGINQLGGTLAGGRTDGRADLTGTYIIERGVARSQDIRLVSGLGNGQAAGTVDLPAWRVDMAGQIDLKQNLLAAYLTRNTSRVPTTLPFQVQGPLDAPNIRLETGALQGGGIAIPGVDRLIEKNPAAGQILQQVLPGLTGQQPPQEQQPQQQKPSAEDLIRGLLQDRGQ